MVKEPCSPAFYLFQQVYCGEIHGQGADVFQVFRNIQRVTINPLQFVEDEALIRGGIGIVISR